MAKKKASELYSYMDTTEIISDITGRTVDGIEKLGSLAGNAIDLGDSYITEALKLRKSTEKLRSNIAKERIALKAFKNKKAMLDGESSTEYEDFKKDMGL